MFTGIGVAIAALVAGLATTGISPRYFLHPTGAIIVLGCTAGVTLISTPRSCIKSAVARILELFHPAGGSREDVIDDIVMFARIASGAGMLAIENSLGRAKDPLLRRALELALEVKDRGEIQKLLFATIRIRQKEREADVKALEAAAGFAPTIGVLGTVIGLIDVFRHFSDLAAVAAGMSTAFMSTIYGLALANLVLLPAAHRIRMATEESVERDDLLAEGVLGIVDGVFPATLRERLNVYSTKAGTP
jgi:chemotaxis protein MotA